MPFKSEKQRRLFHAARKNPAVRKKHGMKKKDVDKMIAHGRPRIAARLHRSIV
jgi:hypothetical protein